MGVVVSVVGADVVFEVGVGVGGNDELRSISSISEDSLNPSNMYSYRAAIVGEVGVGEVIGGVAGPANGWSYVDQIVFRLVSGIRYP